MSDKNRKNKCPLCGDEDIYEGFFNIECTTEDCDNYSKAQVELVKELEKEEVEKILKKLESYDKEPTTVPYGQKSVPTPYGLDDLDTATLDWLIDPIT